MGDFNDDNPHVGVKPTLLKPPRVFKGEHDDISRFLGDCQTYFEVFATYFQLPSQTVPFAASYLEGPAQKWWVHHRQQYWSNSLDDGLPPRFRYPRWGEFARILSNRF
ncbi:hypothetical protein ARMSODRAFT_1022534 [Armillaria solidipes]|uniref:DUF4939 domain-containing protein n=1 Tax=Armillaria solidipes TaxID=1076256 RepID=A0A2H3B2L1_9AGAR|nr:hypothetical protein ARMSODRAFT_1022534 [Armillaria solidipes]